MASRRSFGWRPSAPFIVVGQLFSISGSRRLNGTNEISSCVNDKMWLTPLPLSPLPSPLADLQREGVSLAARVVGRVAGVGIVIGRTKLCPLDRRGLATG